jgi:DNA polymerase-3 subunit gamma/tau
MATQALYLKYRPLTFDQVVGQEPITRTLRNALRQGTVRHAYLFTGPRGTGKTTTARLLAKAVNCLAPAEERPCNACAICTAINEGRLLDLIEVDAASNRGIDEIRDIREKARFRPNQSEYKVYVLDEAHMLTGEAFNALLKTLEEPPPHVLFVLVTTEPHKIPATIASRCQRFDFKRVRLQAIVGRLAFICEQEKLQVEAAGLELIARQSTGGMRDAISLLDQMTSYGDTISLEQIQSVLGTVTSDVAARVARALADGDTATGLELVNTAIGDGADPRQLGHDIVELLRGILLVQHGAGIRLLSTSAEQAAEIEALAARMPVLRVVRAIHLFNEATTDIRRGGIESIPQLPLEMAFVQSLLEGSSGSVPLPQATRTSVPVPSPALHETAGDRPEGAQRALRQEQGDAVSYSASPHPGPPAAAEEEARAPTPGGTEGPSATEVEQCGLELEQVKSAWKQILQAMRQRNQATQAVLASGCRPVEVQGDQLTVTVPSKILAEKLRDSQRKAEIEQVMDEVLGVRCRVRLIVASEYAREAGGPSSQGAVTAPDGQSEAIEEKGTVKAGEGHQPEGDVPDPLARWARQRGGKARMVEP